MLARRTGRRSIDKALAVVSPLAFADATESYVTGLSSEDLRALVLRSVKRMDAPDRTQFAMFLGHDAAESDDVFAGSSIPVAELQRLVESSDALLPNRFAAFLRENPRAVPALGTDALESILAALPEAQFEPDSQVEQSPGRRRISLQTGAILALVLLVAFVPLAAQYAHQRGILSGISNASFVPLQTPVKTLAALTKARISHNAHPAAQPQTAQRKRTHPAQKRMAIARPHHHASLASAPRRVAVHRPVRLAGNWKFDRSVNPYFNKHARPWHDVARRTAAVRVGPENPFEARARLAVRGYLDAVIAGNTASALQHLGMPADGDPNAISESSIISRGARAAIVAVKPGADGQTRVQVDITGRRGEYFEVFSVAHDGPAVRITERYYIPVNRTAEEVSARLLAKNTH